MATTAMVQVARRMESWEASVVAAKAVVKQEMMVIVARAVAAEASAHIGGVWRRVVGRQVAPMAATAVQGRQPNVKR